MFKKMKSYKLIAILTTIVILFGMISPVTSISNKKMVQGCDSGPSFTSVVPVKKTTIVNYDQDSLLDDYAYLSAVPTAVFKDDDKLISHPLLFYEEEFDVKEDRERSLNTYQGFKYFLDDWDKYCDSNMDQMTLINLEKSKIDLWKADDCEIIKADNAYEIAEKLAILDWSYSNDAVIAVIDEQYEKLDIKTSGSIHEFLPSYDVGSQSLEMNRPSIGPGAVYEDFEIKDKTYKYMVADATWADPAYDVDMQIYDDEIGMVSSIASSSWKKGEAREIGGSYIHNYATWEIGLTAFPKKSISEGKMKSMYDNSEILSSGLFSKFLNKKVNVNINLYPGIEIELDKLPSFGVTDAKFNLDWTDPNIKLGMTVVDAQGTEIASSLEISDIINQDLEESSSKVELEIASLGECREGENYKVIIFSLNDINHDLDFCLDYEWTQTVSKEEGMMLAGATNGAVLASALNAPLLYTSKEKLLDSTKETLLKLGVENIYLIDFESYSKKAVIDELKTVGEIIQLDKPEKIYEKITELTDTKDIIFTTIEPFRHWYVAELAPADEDFDYGARFIGPSAYIAAHHGSPVFVVDVHPELSQAVVYHKDFWIKNAQYRTEPSAGDMVLSGRQAYAFLDSLGFDQEGVDREDAMETIITVAGQFNIGPTWDRTFVGKATSGRFHFSPVDTSYWISRSVFYPAMIYSNPAMDTVTLNQGSSSTIERIGGRLRKPIGVNLVVHEEGKQEFKYPILQTYVSSAYKFNQQASKHWGTYYTRADGITPYITVSPDPIDNGATDKKGAYYPDLDDTNVIPFYAERAGYSNVFSTNFDKVAENLNEGVLVWVQDSHGYHPDGGRVSFWDPQSPYIYEENPWRAYEPIMLKLGHMRTFIHWLMYMAGEYLGIGALGQLSQIKIPWQIFSERGCTENPDVALFNPNLAKASKLVGTVTGGLLEILGAFGFMIHWDRLIDNPDRLPIITTYDGMVTTSTRSGAGLIEKGITGLDFDDALENLHSAGINTVVCLPAGTYLQMTWIRHGAVYTIMDPWSTSDYCAVWLQSIIKHLAMGDTIGQAYEKGIRACGPEYLVDHWWWDAWENVCFYGDPDLRVYVPNDEWDESEVPKNKWDKPRALGFDKDLDIQGHMPFGADSYPNEKQAKANVSQTIILLIVGLIILLVLALFLMGKKKK
jgi:hypothetical protein